jgi:hypothetical protein
MMLKKRLFIRISLSHNLRPLKNLPFCSISASDSNFNPRNTQCMSVVNPAKAGSPSLNLNKNEYFSKVSMHDTKETYLGKLSARIHLIIFLDKTPNLFHKILFR